MYYNPKRFVCQILAYGFLFLQAAYCEEGASVSIAINKKIIKSYSVEISSPEIKSSLNEAFAVCGLDMQRSLIHPDISIKGGTFQQGAVFIDGIRIDDPQTAHNILNIPLTPDNIEKVEFLPARGYAGGINIITNRANNNILAEISAGDFSTANGRITVSRIWEKCSGTASFEKKHSDGYAYDTGYDVTTFFNKYELFRPSFESEFLFGYLKKNFGANGYYANFPSYERTETYLSQLNIDYDCGGFLFKPGFQFKRNTDNFELDISRPGWSQNSHRTDIYSGHINVSKNNFFSGADISEEEMTSTNLGKHKRTIGGFTANYSYAAGRSLELNPGFDLTKLPGNSVFSPSLIMDCGIAEGLKLNAMIRHSARPPSFTELYYRDAANTGNEGLNCEKAVLFETGLNYSGIRFNVFRRNEKDIIDWIKLNAADPKWQAVNIGKAEFYGYELSAKINAGGMNTRISYSRVDSSKKPDFISKYALRYANHIITGETTFPLFYGIEQSADCIYKKRISGEEYFVMDAEISKNYSMGKYYLKIANILNRNYTEIPFVQMPPRIFSLGITINL